LRTVCYNFVISLLKNSLDNFKHFFTANVLDSIKKEKPTEHSIDDDFPTSNAASAAMARLWNTNYGKREGHVGIKNLGCICYMNSMMQQFFMVPTFRYSLLQVDDKIEPKWDSVQNYDDNTLHQVQRMFTFLDVSEREDYNPNSFCLSFKDWDGNSVNTSIQQDSQEFLNRFIDKMEEAVKPTQFKYLLNSVFGGKTCSQLICEQGCGNMKNRYEDFYNLSLEVSNMKTIYDSLEKFIAPEKIDDYQCETCQKKVTITKRNSLAHLPNVLIVYLQRIYYNYELDRNEKINSKLEFPHLLNLKNYTMEELYRKSQSKNNMVNEDELETDEIYFKTNDAYEYQLVGVNVHIGTADGGHYFSYINSKRGGQGNEAEFDNKDDAHKNCWLKFNDSFISKFK